MQSYLIKFDSVKKGVNIKIIDKESRYKYAKISSYNCKCDC